MSAADQTLAVLCALLAVELVLLRHGQRRLFGVSMAATRSRLFAYVLAAPGTALHEAAHYLACRALAVPTVGRTRLFWPQRTPEGHVVLGSVSHARTDALRQALISIAPLLLVPPMLVLATALLLSPHALSALPNALGDVPWWRAALWGYLALSCAQAVFPSPGDRLGAAELGCLVGLAAGGTLLVLAVGHLPALLQVLGVAVGILALPAAAAGASLFALGLLRSATAPRL